MPFEFLVRTRHQYCVVGPELVSGAMRCAVPAISVRKMLPWNASLVATSTTEIWFEVERGPRHWKWMVPGCSLSPSRGCTVKVGGGSGWDGESQVLYWVPAQPALAKSTRHSACAWAVGISTWIQGRHSRDEGAGADGTSFASSRWSRASAGILSASKGFTAWSQASRIGPRYSEIFSAASFAPGTARRAKSKVSATSSPAFQRRRISK